MTAIAGSIGLYVALFGALAAAGLWGYAAWRCRTGAAPPGEAVASARQATWLSFAGSVLAVGVMEWALVSNDFALAYVAENSSRATPLLYRITALWSALDGSLLLWLLVLTGYGVLLGRGQRLATRDKTSAILGLTATSVVSLVTVSFAVLVVAATRPFARLTPSALDGPGPNPLLADHPAMAIHPPLLYLGYIGLVVPFGYAVAALVLGHAGGHWVQLTRRWVLAAWICLTAGIVLGAWWSYAVLGWGGYWAWDPVENASLLPWLTATALLHSALRARSRGGSPVWNVSLAAASFLLVISGTFLTRSGVVESVHSFTNSPLGPALLSLLVGWLSVVVGLLIWRSGRLVGPQTGRGPDRQAGRGLILLVNNMLLVALAVMILVGTLVPVISAVFASPVSVGAPYYNRLAVPIGLVLLGFISWATITRWRAESGTTVRRRGRLPLAVATVAIAALGLGGARGVAPVLALGLAAAVVAAAGREIATVLRSVPAGRWWHGRRLLGGQLAHIGLAIAAAGIAASSAWNVSTQDVVPVGGSITAGNARADVVGVESTLPSGRTRTAVEVRLAAAGGDSRSAAPALEYFPGRDQTVTVPAILSTWRGDVYVTVLAVADDRSTVTLRLADEPLIGWLWAGGALMVLGGALAVAPRRRRRAEPGGEDDQLRAKRPRKPLVESR